MVPVHEVVVVGGGPIGAAAARHLSLETDGVVIVSTDEPVEFRDHEGPWSGSYDAGRIAHALDLPLLSSVIGLRSRRRFASLESETGVHFSRSVPYMAVVPPARGATEGAPQSDDWSNLESQRMIAADLGVRYEEIPPEDLLSRFPDLHFAPGNVGLLQPDGLLIDPRKLVEAELTAALGQGAQRISGEVIKVDPGANQVRVHLKGGQVLRAKKVVLAAGAYINGSGLSERPIPYKTFGCTIVLVHVPDPSSAAAQFPSLMYVKDCPVAPYRGIVLPPVRYPDGQHYIKVAGDSLFQYPLEDYESIGSWVRSGGHAPDMDLVEVVRELVPDLRLGEVTTRPCLVTVNHSGSPYIDLLEKNLAVVTEGEHGVTMADELGRLAARLVIDGEWRDALPFEPFQIPHSINNE